MSRSNATGALRAVAWRVMAAVLLTGLPLRAPLAQQPAANGSGSAHATAASHGKGTSEANISISLRSRPLTKQGSNMTPAKDRPLLPVAPNVSDRNAIGMAVARHDAMPIAPLVGHAVVGLPAPQSGGSGFALRGGQVAPVHMPGAQPPVSSRSTLAGASFTRPSNALLPLGGPAKPGAATINGTGIRPKH